MTMKVNVLRLLSASSLGPVFRLLDEFLNPRPGQVLWFFILGDLGIRATSLDVGTITAVEHTNRVVFLEHLDQGFGVGLEFGLDQFQGAFKGDRIGVVAFVGFEGDKFASNRT